MSTPASGFPRRALHIGLVAYGLDGPNPSLVFVRVPTERGRWVLTDRCVVEVACEHCGAVQGEPCRRGRQRSPVMHHGAGTHVVRRDAWQHIKGSRNWRKTPKIRLSANDLTDAQEVIHG